MRKFILFIFLMFSVIALGACDEGAITEHRKVFSETLITYATGDDADHVTENITLRTSSEAVPEAILTWVSSDSSIIEIIDDIGEVTRPDITTTVVLTLKVSINDVVKQQKYSLTVIELEDSNDDEDTTPPVILGAENITLYVGDPEQDWLEGVYAEDDVDEEVEVEIIENTVDLDHPGSYHIVYEATDQAGNSSQVTIIVTVLEVVIDPEVTYVETFTNIPNSGSVYGDLSFTGINGVRWAIVGSRSDQDLDGKALTFGGMTDNSKLSATITGGISSLSFDARKSFTNENERKLELKINGVSYGIFTIDPKSETSAHFEVKDIKVAGEFTLELIHITGTSSRAQITIDNLTWTTYSGVQIPVEKENLDKDVAGLTVITNFMEAESISFPLIGQFGSAIEWSYVDINNPNNYLVDLDTGAITLPESGQVNVGIKATLTNGEYYAVKTFNFVIGEGDPIKISNVYNQSKDTKVKIQGVITSVYEINGATYFFVQDGTAGILVIASDEDEVVVGNEVILIGAVDIVNSEVRLNRLTKIEVIGSDTVEPVLVNNPTNLKNYQGQLIEVSGLLQASYSSNATSYVLVNDKGSFELVIPNGLASDIITSIQSLFGDKDAGILVNVIGTVSRNQNKYQLLLVDESNIVFDDEVDQDIVWSVVSEYIVIPNFTKPISSNITLPNNIDVIEGLEIKWTSSHPTIISTTGVVNQIDSEVEVTLTYDILLDNVFIYSGSVFVVVLEKSSYDGYYDSINGLSGDALKAELKRIISKMKNIAYKETSYILDESDVDPSRSGNVLLVYNRASVSGVWNGTTWNKEHLWPQSKLGSASKSDLFNLRPANPSINSSRGNLPFVDGSGTYGKVGSGWFPGEKDKGDVARAIFYMNTRWGLSINSQIGNLNTFIKWHNEDPVDDFERHRNEVIYSYQGNRNPYVDYPELVGEIYGTYTRVFSTTNDVPVYLIAFEELKRNYYEV